jgi:hypothetical protein
LGALLGVHVAAVALPVSPIVVLVACIVAVASRCTTLHERSPREDPEGV